MFFSGFLRQSPFFMPTTSKNTADRKRFQTKTQVHAPVLFVGDEGLIKEATPAAARLLEYPANAKLGSCFYSLVNRRNMAQVTRDLQDMVKRRKSKAEWLLRLWTGRNRWRWYKASAYTKAPFTMPESAGEDPIVAIHLRDVHAW